MTAIDSIILDYKLAYELLSVNFNTGILTWNVRDRKYFSCNKSHILWNITYSGKRAGTRYLDRGSYYYQVCIFKKIYKVHRIIWLMKNRTWPNIIDHIDHNGANNNIDNLRSVTHQENQKNRRMSVYNTSGITGVSMTKQNGKWRASIKVCGKQKYIGYYDDFFEAVCARKSAEIKYGFHENHGK